MFQTTSQFSASKTLRENSLENANCTGRRHDGKARHIIAKLYGSPFKRNLLRVANNPGKKQLLDGERLVEDLTPDDFELRKKALPRMKRVIRRRKESVLY